MQFQYGLLWVKYQLVPVVWWVDNVIRWINLYPVDSAVLFGDTYPLDSVVSPLDNWAQMTNLWLSSEGTENLF